MEGPQAARLRLTDIAVRRDLARIFDTGSAAEGSMRLRLCGELSISDGRRFYKRLPRHNCMV